MPQSLLKLAIPRNSEIEFFQNFLTYKGEKILCSDIDGIAYLYTRTKHSINFIPTGMTHAYTISFRSRGILYKFSFSGENNQEVFNKFVGAINLIIKPFVVVNQLLDYIKSNRLQIGDLTIKPEGLYRKRFWRKPELLPWSKYYNSSLNKGYVLVLKKDDSKKEYSTFYTISMSSLNAIVMPDIINFIFANNGVVDDVTRKQIIERKAQLTTASAQDAIQDFKRCPKCNEIIDASKEYCAKCSSQYVVNNPSTINTKKVQEEITNKSESGLHFCAQCGKPINKESKFCGNCGKVIISST